MAGSAPRGSDGLLASSRSRTDVESVRPQWEIAEEFAARLGTRRRKAGAPVRNLFVADDREAVKPPMAQLLSGASTGGGGRGGQLRLKMYLSLLWAASAEPYQVVRPARAWAGLLGLPDPQGRGARRIQSTLRELADRGLISLESRGGMPNVVTLLSDIGTGDPYESPSETHNRLRTSRAPNEQLLQHQYFRIPSSVWTSGLIARLSGPALAMLLVLRCEQRSKDGSPVWFSPSRATNRFGLSESTRRAGLEELAKEGLVRTTSQMLSDNGGSLDVYRRRKVHTLDFTRPPQHSRALPTLRADVEPERSIEKPSDPTLAYEQILLTRERILGPDHPDTLSTRVSLALAYAEAGRLSEAITLLEQNFTDHERILGPDHPDTLATRTDLATTYRRAGRDAEAIPLHEQSLADHERVLGTKHRGTIAARGKLANAYAAVGRSDEAIALYGQNLADHERSLGLDDPTTLNSRVNLGIAYSQAGHTTEALSLLEQSLADRERVLGSEHPDTLLVRNELATTYGRAGRAGDAILIFEQNLIDSERLLGPDHPNTLAARSSLANAYRDVGRLDESIPLYEKTLTDAELVLGSAHPNVLATRHNLANAYRDVGRLNESIPLYEKTLTDTVRVLGPDHPQTVSLREFIASFRNRI